MAKRIAFVVIVLVIFQVFAFSQDGTRTVYDDIDLLSAIHDSMTVTSNLVELSTDSRKELVGSLSTIDSVRRYLVSVNKNTDYKTILRMEGSNYWLGVRQLRTENPPVYQALQFVKKVANDESVQSQLEAIGRLNLITPVVINLQRLQLKASLEQSREKLNRYEKKYGPGSARLNIAESAVNFFFLRNVPLFGTGDDGPGPLEFISAYSSSYVTAYNAETEKLFKDIGIVSALEIGVRYYFLGEGWGEEGFWNGIAKPGFATAGLLVTGEEAGFFKSPLKGKESYGLFLSWGGLKAGYIVGDNSRILLSRQFQVVPYLF